MALGLFRFTNALGGTADFIYPGPAIDMQSPASAGASDGSIYVYYAQSLDMSEWEKGSGAYSVATKKIARTTVLANSLGTTAKINFSNPPQVFVLDSFGGGRTKLSSDTNFYVRTDGNDANDGMSNTSAGAFLTIQRAVNVALTLDLSGFTLTINVADGTYAAGASVTGTFVGGTVIIKGNVATPANCIIAPASGDCFYGQNTGVVFKVGGFKLVPASGAGIRAVVNSTIYVNAAMEYGASSAAHLYAEDGGYINIGGNPYTISGGATYHVIATSAGRIQMANSTVTLTGTPAFSSAFAQAQVLSLLTAYGMTFIGPATGVRYAVASNSVIFTGGGGPNYFPGNVAGSGSLYI